MKLCSLTFQQKTLLLFSENQCLEYETRIAKLEEDHETELAKLKQNHETEIVKLNQNHKTELTKPPKKSTKNSNKLMSRVAAIVGPSAEDKQIAKINNNIKGVYNSRVASDELGENRQKELNESFLLESVAFLSYLSHFVFSRLISGAQSCRF